MKKLDQVKDKYGFVYTKRDEDFIPKKGDYCTDDEGLHFYVVSSVVEEEEEDETYRIMTYRVNKKRGPTTLWGFQSDCPRWYWRSPRKQVILVLK